MKQLLLVAAVVGLATTGCAQNGMLGRSKCRDGGCHVTRSQMAPRPEIMRTACRGGGCFTDQCAGGCDCGEVCDGGCAYAASDCGPGGCYGSDGGYDCNASGCGRCRGCLSGGGCLCPHSGGYPEPRNFNPSPPTGQTAYPYYTTRGPRDFLQSNPPSIGPN